MKTSVCVYTHIYTDIYTDMYICICVYSMCVYVYTHTIIVMHIHTSTFIHTHIHIYTHIYKYVNVFKLNKKFKKKPHHVLLFCTLFYIYSSLVCFGNQQDPLNTFLSPSKGYNPQFGKHSFRCWKYMATYGNQQKILIMEERLD